MWELIWPELRRYLWIDGRSSRREWWQIEAVVLFSYWFVGAGATVLALLHGEPSLLPAPIRLVLSVVVFWINIASTVRRLHDRNRSGWWGLVYFFPLFGIVWHFIECGLLPGSKQSNRYGSPPVDDSRSPLERIAEILKQAAYQPLAPRAAMPPAPKRTGIPTAVPRKAMRPAAMPQPAMPTAASQRADTRAARPARQARMIGGGGASAVTRPRSHGKLVLAIVAFIAIVVLVSSMVTVRVTEVGVSKDLPVFVE